MCWNNCPSCLGPSPGWRSIVPFTNGGIHIHSLQEIQDQSISRRGHNKQSAQWQLVYWPPVPFIFPLGRIPADKPWTPVLLFLPVTLTRCWSLSLWGWGVGVWGVGRSQFLDWRGATLAASSRLFSQRIATRDIFAPREHCFICCC